MVLISLEDAKAEVRKVVPDFKTRYDINYRLNSLPSIELEEDAEQTEPQTDPCDGCVCDDGKHLMYCMNCKGIACKTEPQIDEFFRQPTEEEMKSVRDYIDSISVPTGVNVFDLMDEPQKEVIACPIIDDDAWIYKDEPQREGCE